MLFKWKSVLYPPDETAIRDSDKPEKMSVNI